MTTDGGGGSGGADASMVICRPALAGDVFPARSVIAAEIVCWPTARVLDVIDQFPEPSAVAVPSTVVPSVSNNETAAFASLVPVKVGVASLVMLSVFDAPVSDAALRSGAEGAAADVSST